MESTPEPYRGPITNSFNSTILRWTKKYEFSKQENNYLNLKEQYKTTNITLPEPPSSDQLQRQTPASPTQGCQVQNGPYRQFRRSNFAKIRQTMF